MTEESHAIDLTGDEMCGDPRRPRRRYTATPEANEHATGADSLTGEVEERHNEQP